MNRSSMARNKELSTSPPWAKSRYKRLIAKILQLEISLTLRASTINNEANHAPQADQRRAPIANEGKPEPFGR